jgi:hypothetical protein
MVDENHKSHRDRMPSAHDIAEELLKEVISSGSTGDFRHADPEADTPIDIPAYHNSTPLELRWIERRIGKSVIWGVKAIVVSALIFIGSAMGSVLWTWINRK